MYDVLLIAKQNLPNFKLLLSFCKLRMTENEHLKYLANLRA